MIDRLRYDFDSESRLIIDGPQNAYDEALAQTRLGEVLSHELGLVTEEHDTSGVRLTLQRAPFKTHRWDTEQREAAASQWLYAITSTRKMTPSEYIDPILDAQPAQGSMNDASGQNRIPFYAKLAWPIDDPVAAQAKATEAMRDTALTLGYLKKSIIDSAFASVSIEYGVEFQSLDMGCSCLGTNGSSYDSNAEYIELYGHNLYSRQMVLTCFSGLVAVARHKG